MKVKEFGLSVIFNLFLGYLWLLFMNHIVSIANSMNNTFIVGGLIIFIGSVLFFEIVKRITPFHAYKFTHPVKLAGLASFFVVLVVHTFIFNII